jgi:hypothetical protein
VERRAAVFGIFEANFKRFEAHVDADVKNAASKNQMAA